MQTSNEYGEAEFYLGIIYDNGFAKQPLKRGRNNHNTDGSRTKLWASAYFGKYFRNTTWLEKKDVQMHLNLEHMHSFLYLRNLRTVHNINPLPRKPRAQV